MTSVSRRRQVERFIQDNVPSYRTNPATEQWKKDRDAATEAAVKAIPAAVRRWLDENDGYHAKQVVNEVRNQARSQFTHAPENIDQSSEKRTLMQRAMAAQSEDEIQAVLYDASALLD